jgi:hypothetical protein
MNHLLKHLRHNVIAYVALFFAVGAGGGYAVAAASKKTIHGCVNNRTHVLLVQKRCHRGERPIVWSQQGPQGTPGRPGSSPVTAWTVVGGSGSTVGGHGIVVQHVATGTYRVTATPAQCAQLPASSPVVTPSDSNPPAGHTAGAFPVAWVGDDAGGTFTVFTGVVSSGMFSPADLTFNIQESCS